MYQSANIHFTLMYQSVSQQPPYSHTLQSGSQQMPQLIGLCNTVNLSEPKTNKTSSCLYRASTVLRHYLIIPN